MGEEIRTDGKYGIVKGFRLPVLRQSILDRTRAAIAARAPLLLWGLLAVLVLTGTFGHSLLGTNETRGAGMIWDMYRHQTWVYPTLNGVPFLEKPPLVDWTALVLCHLTGRIDEGLVRFPSALYAFGTLLLLYLFVSNHGDARREEGAPRLSTAAWISVLTCATALEFFAYTHYVLCDMALVFCTTLALVLFWGAYRSPNSWKWFAFLLAAAAAFYAKGLIGPVLVWAGVGPFLLWKRRFKLLAVLGGAFIPVALILVLPWVRAMASTGGMEAVRFFFWDNQVGRFFHFGNRALPHDPFFVNKEPVYYYFANLPLRLLPWSLLLIPALAAWWKRSTPYREEVHGFLRFALAGMLLVLHASSAKVTAYALPAYPLLFAMLGLWMRDALRRPALSRGERWALIPTAAACVALPVAAAVLYLLGPTLWPGLFPAGPQTVPRFAGAGLMLAAVPFALRRGAGHLRAGNREHLGIAMAAGTALTVIGTVYLATPAVEYSRSCKPVVDLARGQIAQGREFALASTVYGDIGAFTFYLDRRIDLLDPPSEVLRYLDSPRPRAAIVRDADWSTLKPRLAGLPVRVLHDAREGGWSRSYVLLVNQ